MAEPNPPREAPRPHRGLLATALAAGAALRLGHWAAVRDEPFFARLAMDSQEYDRWAREIARGDWLGSEPFFQAPLYPYLVALIYRVAGFSYDAVYLVQIAVALAGLYALGRAGAELGGARVGGLAAWGGALYLPFVFYDVQLLKESFAVAAVAALLWALAAARRRGAARLWATAGLLAGLLALLRENFLLVAPLLPLLVLGGSGGAAGCSRRAGAFVAAFALVLAPVAARNAALGGGFLPTTSQGGVNFWIGNHAGADGTYRPLTPGRQIPRLERAEPRRLAEAEAGRTLSAGEVSRHWLRKSLAWARAEPGAFLALQGRKLALFASGYEWPDAVDYYWTKQRSPALALPLGEWGAVVWVAAAGALLVLVRRRLADYAPALLLASAGALATVVFFVFARYRLPVVPPLLVLAAAAVDELVRQVERRRWLPAGVALAAAAALWAAPHLAGYRPRVDLVEYNLGRLAQEGGDLAAAERHYTAALAADPSSFLAAMNAGTLAARRGELPLARARLERAAALAPESADVQANLGAARLAAGDLVGARAALARALTLEPGHPSARANLERLTRSESQP